MYVAVIRQIVLLLGVSSAVSLSSAANAADLPARPVATPGPQPLTAEWNRFYLSVHGDWDCCRTLRLITSMARCHLET